MTSGRVLELCVASDQGGLLPALVAAALGAPRPPDELVVIDNASTDATPEILASLRARHPRFASRRNPTPCGADAIIAEIIATTSCDYLVVRAADERDAPELLARGVAQLDAHPEAAFFATDVAYYVDPDGPRTMEPAGVPGAVRFVAPDRFTEDFGGNSLHRAGIVFRTSAIRAVGGFPPQYAWHSDWFVLMSLAFTHGFIYEPIVGAEVFLSSSSYNPTGTKNLANAQSVFTAMVDALRAEHPPTLYAAFRQHAVFDMLGGRFRDFLREYEDGAAFDLTDYWGDPTIRQQRRATGIPTVVRRTLQQARAVIAAADRFYIYGAGLHTEIVLDGLQELGLPSPLAIIATHPSGPPFVRGIPVGPLEVVEDAEASVILISSKSFEGEMFQLARVRFPRTPILTVWGEYGSLPAPPAGGADETGPVNQSYLAGLTDRLIEAGKVHDATALLQRVLLRDADNAFALCRLGMLLFRKGQYAEAAAHLNHALRTWDQSPETHLFLGLARLARGEPAAAVQALAQGIAIHPGYCQMILSDAAESTSPTAIPLIAQAFAVARAAKPDDHEIPFFHGRYLSRLGRHSDAIGLLQQALTAAPGFAPAHYELGVAHCTAGNVTAALDHCRDAIYLDPSWHDRERLFGLLLEHREALLHFIEDSIALPELRAMVSDLLAQSGANFPSNCWLFNLLLNVTQLQRAGIENFKNTVNQNYFNWVPSQLDEQIEALESSCVAAHHDYRNQRPAWTPATWSESDWERYARFVHLLWRFAQLHDPLGLLTTIEEPALGNPLTITVDGIRVSQDLGNSALELNAALAGIPAERRATLSFAELGAGYGRLPFLLLANFPAIRVTIIDIPPALFLSQWYLTRCFPQVQAFTYRPFNRFEEVAVEFQQAQLRFISADQCELLPPDSFDLFVSVATLQEMTREQIARWINQIDRTTRGRVYLKQWRQHFDDLNRIRVDDTDYPFPTEWRALFTRSCPAQPRFFESCFEVKGAPRT